jgi:DNA-binding response OmpR family regulator
MAVATLRKKVEAQPSKPRLLITVKGVGYRWSDE